MSRLGKLGSFEGYGVSAGNLGFGSTEGHFGNLGQQDDYDAGYNEGGYGPPPAPTGASGVLTGIAAILAPLTQAGVGIYGANMRAKEAKRARKAALYAGRTPAVEETYDDSTAYVEPKSNTGLIVGILVLLLAGGGFMMWKSKQAPVYGPIQRPVRKRKKRKNRKNKRKKRR